MLCFFCVCVYVVDYNEPIVVIWVAFPDSISTPRFSNLRLSVAKYTAWMKKFDNDICYPDAAALLTRVQQRRRGYTPGFIVASNVSRATIEPFSIAYPSTSVLFCKIDGGESYVVA